MVVGLGMELGGVGSEAYLVFAHVGTGAEKLTEFYFGDF